MPAGQGVSLAEGTRLSGIVVGHLTDQARRTAKAARAGRVTTRRRAGSAGPDAVAQLFPELAEELRKVRPRERIARALRQAADIIDPPTPVH